MNLSINTTTSYIRTLNSKNYIKSTQYKSLKTDLSFQGINNNKTIKYALYPLTACFIASLFSCTSPKKQDSISDTTEAISQTDKTAGNDSIQETQKKEKTVKTYYHYLPSNNKVDAGNYDWIEKVYPDGSIEIDSLGYKKITNPNGEQTISYTQTNENGETITKTAYSDGSNKIRKEKNGSYNDTIYWQNGNIKQIQNMETEFIKKESGSETIKSIKNKTFKHYNENGVLLYWQIFERDNDIEQPEDSLEYDSMGRLINDGLNIYEYHNDDNTIPFRYTSEFEGCKLITELDEYGVEENKYFEASDGTITPYSEVEVGW